jgi:error-prone DNA polymerase
LAAADAFAGFGLDRRRALWAVRGLDLAPLPLFAGLEAAAGDEAAVALPQAGLGEEVASDFRALTLSLRAHPLALLRGRLAGRGVVASAAIAGARHGRRAKTAGLVITRQRPGSARGVLFLTLEDECGHTNLIVWPDVFERFRHAVLRATLLGVEGTVQREGAVVHLLADRLVDLDALLGTLAPHLAPRRAGDDARFDVSSRDFH